MTNIWHLNKIYLFALQSCFFMSLIYMKILSKCKILFLTFLLILRINTTQALTTGFMRLKYNFFLHLIFCIDFLSSCLHLSNILSIYLTMNRDINNPSKAKDVWLADLSIISYFPKPSADGSKTQWINSPNLFLREKSHNFLFLEGKNANHQRKEIAETNGLCFAHPYTPF